MIQSVELLMPVFLAMECILSHRDLFWLSDKDDKHGREHPDKHEADEAGRNPVAYGAPSFLRTGG
jgi:hypothetical protein